MDIHDGTFTDPEVFAAAARGESWADPETDPTRIDWVERQARALIPFKVVDGRPVNPCQTTEVRYGRNGLGHWGEQPCADALVTAKNAQGHRWIVMVERADGHGWALPGGKVDPGEDPTDAAFRELREETGLDLDRSLVPYDTLLARYMPDPRGSDESWMVSALTVADLGVFPTFKQMPAVVGASDAKRARWVLADSYDVLVEHLSNVFDGHVFTAHVDLLRELLS